MAQRHQVVDIIVVVGADHNIHNSVKDGALLHGWLGSGGLDIILDLFRHLLQAVHVQDLLPDFILVFLDSLVSIDLLGVEVGHDLDRPLAKDVSLKDVREGGLGVHGKDQAPVPLFCQPVGCSRGKGRLAQSAFATEHDIAAFGAFFKSLSQ